MATGSGFVPIVANGAKSKSSWILKVAMLLIVIIVLSIIAMQPSDSFSEKPATRYAGIKAFVACPQETRVTQFLEHGNQATKLLSARCAELARTLQTSKQIINKILLLNVEEIDAETKFADICDSLDKVEILTALQTQFNVTLREDIIPKIATVGDAVGLIEELRNKEGVLT